MPVKFYGYLIGSLIFCGMISYHFVYTSILKSKINNLEIENIEQQHRVINCKTNLAQTEAMLRKQNEKLQGIGIQIEANLKDINLWKNKTEEEKYNEKVINIFKSTDLNDIVRQLNQLDLKDI